MRIVKLAAAALAVFVIAAIGFVYLAPESATRLALDLERQRAGLVRKHIDLPGGLHYAYLEGGQGEPLMLLHGFGADKDNFTRGAFLTPHFRVIVPDQIGFGESAHPQQADYAPIAQAARSGPGAGAGHPESAPRRQLDGGHIALTYAALHPAEVKSLWLLDPAGVWSAPESELRKIVRQTGKNPLMARSEDEFAGIFAFVMSDPPFIPRPMLNVIARERIQNFALEARIFKQLAADSVEARHRPGHIDFDCVGRTRPRDPCRNRRRPAQTDAEFAGRPHAGHRPFANDRAATAERARLPAVSSRLAVLNQADAYQFRYAGGGQTHGRRPA